jgi:hypothetical protein
VGDVEIALVFIDVIVVGTANAAARLVGETGLHFVLEHTWIGDNLSQRW